MRGLCIAVISLGAFVAAGNASAQIVDVAKISCKDYLAGTVVRRDYLTLWLSGYYNGTRNDTIVQTNTVQTIADKVGTYCRANLDSGLMDAVQKAVSGGK